MTFVAAGATRTRERREGGGSHAGFFGLAEGQADIEDAEAADEASGRRREQRTLQATDRDGEVSAEGRAGRVVAEPAWQVDRDT